MTMTYSTPGRSSARMWFGFLAGPAAYGMQLLLGYALTPLACSSTKAPLHLLSAAAVGVVVTAAVLSFRAWRARSARTGTTDAVGFMFQAGFVLSLIFLLLILATALNIIMLAPCRLA
jgi:hypothetical protein